LSYDPTPTQALLLFGILARHGVCKQAELIPKVKKADREVLIKEKLITDGKVGNSIKLTLADGGWAWTATNLSAPLPPAQRTLSDLLARLGEHLSKSGKTLGAFIGSKPEEILPAASAPKRSKGAAKPPKPKPPKPAKTKLTKSKRPPPTALRKLIEAAYLAVTDGRKDESVRLTRLRAELSDLDRATVDAALSLILAGDKAGKKKASLMRHDDPHQLDQADHDAAFNPAGEPFHVLWIAS
jgi:hypothetical protein